MSRKACVWWNENLPMRCLGAGGLDFKFLLRKRGKNCRFYEIIQANNPVWEADHNSP